MHGLQCLLLRRVLILVNTPSVRTVGVGVGVGAVEEEVVVRHVWRSTDKLDVSIFPPFLFEF
jgi:hypothetical protein